MNWEQTLPPGILVASASDELIAQSIRTWRNFKLAASDWTQLPDVDLTNKWDWAVYRQQLRDMMQQHSDPKLIVFPTAPSVSATIVP
jgi:hypothetical protein